MKVIVLPNPTISIDDLRIPDPTEVDLEHETIMDFLERTVQGWVEIVTPAFSTHPLLPVSVAPNGVLPIMAVNEEGRYRDDFNINPLASMFYGYGTHSTPIVGPAVLLGRTMQGDLTHWPH